MSALKKRKMSSSPPPLVMEVEVERDEEEDSGRGSNNPMLNDNVPPPLPPQALDNLFGYLEFKDLSRCRLVSQQWFKVTLPHWLRKAPMITLDLDETRSSSWRPGKEPNRNMFTFLTATHNDFRHYGSTEYAGLRKYRKFETRGDTNLPHHHQLLQNFLRRCGEWITELQVSLTFRDLNVFQGVMLSRMTPNLVKLTAEVIFTTNGRVDFEEKQRYDDLTGGQAAVHTKLKSLEIQIINDMDDDDEDDEDEDNEETLLPVIAWIQLFQRYPNLKTLVHGKGSRLAELRNADRMLEAIWTIRQADRTLLDLKHLDIDFSMGEHHDPAFLLPLLRDTGLALETFRMSFGERTPNQTIYELLESQAATLKELCIRKFDPIINFQQPPRMNSVQILELVEEPMHNLGFLKSFPCLEFLSISFSLYANSFSSILSNTTQEDHLEGLVIPSLTRLQCTYGGEHGISVRLEDIRKLQQVMPNLTHVKLWLNNESLRAVCECWPQLQSLTIVGAEVDDEGIQHHITNLKGLKHLVMRNAKAYGIGPTAITSKSLAEFLKLPNLEELEISIDTELDVDRNVVNALEAKIKNCTIYRATQRKEINNDKQDQEDRRASGDDSGDESESSDDDGSDRDNHDDADDD